MKPLEELLHTIRRTKRVYICGNGGSAANAIHFANDLVSVGVRAHALTADVATLTAIANDYGYEEVFSRQLRLYAEPRDMLIVLSGSGRSPSILKALWDTRSCPMYVCAIFGAYNDHSENFTKINLLFSEGLTMQEAEEAQLRIAHEVMLGLRVGKISPAELTPNMVNKFFEEDKIPAKCGAIVGERIILSIDEQNNAAMENTQLWLKRTTGQDWVLQVQPLQV